MKIRGGSEAILLSLRNEQWSKKKETKGDKKGKGFGELRERQRDLRQGMWENYYQDNKNKKNNRIERYYGKDIVKFSQFVEAVK